MPRDKHPKQEADILENLSGDPTDLADEDLDTLFTALVPGTDPAANIRNIAQAAAVKYRTQNKMPPDHVQAAIDATHEIKTLHNAPASVLRAEQGSTSVNTLSELSAVLQDARQKDDLFGALKRLIPPEEDERMNFFESLAAVHNSGAIDLVTEFGELRNEQNGPDFFLKRHVFERVLPALDATPEHVARTVAHLITQSGQDMASHTPLDAFRRFLDKAPVRPIKALAAIENAPDSLALLTPATSASGFTSDPMYFTEQLIRLANSPIEELQRMAVFSLGSAPVEGEEDRLLPRVIQTIETAIENTDRDGTLAAALAAAIALSTKGHSAYPRLGEIIRKALEKGREWTLGAAAEAYAFQTGTLQLSLLELLSEHLKTRAPADNSTLQRIDFGVSSLLGSSNRTLALEVLGEMLKRFPNSVQLKAFPCSQSTIDSSLELLSQVVTRWLASGDPPLCKAAADAVQHARRDDLSIEADLTQLSRVDEQTLVFVARKAVGYLFFSPIAATSLVISLMRSGAVEPLKRLLLNSLLLNYTGSLGALLQSRFKAESEPVASAIQECLAQTETYLADIRSASEIKELRSSEEQRAAFHKSFGQKVSKSFEAARSEMPLLSLVKRSIVLYGRGSVQHSTLHDGSTRRADLMFKTLGTEIAVPRMLHIDPLGLEFYLRILRVEKRAK